MSSHLQLQWAAICATGGRETNQDAIGAATRASMHCFVLADGAGGHAGGEVAARLVVNSVLGAFTIGAHLPGCATNAEQAVTQARTHEAQHADMSATLAACVIDLQAGLAQWAHLGDSRVYLFRDADVLCATRDHSLTQQLIDAGLARIEQLRVHPQRNILYAAVGAHGDTPVAFSEAVPLRPGDALLLCSDGLWEWVLEAEMVATLSGCADSQSWLDALCAVAQANHAASNKVRDNYSAYAVRIGGAGA
jgi:serine/threonine protein phosphatase PrpC